MLYLSGCLPNKKEIRHLLWKNGIGLLLTPQALRRLPEQTETYSDWDWAADNACFSNKWDSSKWLRWLQTIENPEKALFATVPDVVASHEQTIERWHEWWESVKTLNFKPAFVIQNGATPNQVPFDQAEAIFIGGTTEWKLSDAAREIVVEAKQRGLWVHMGRVNSVRRLQIASEWGCDSVDGTMLAFAPDTNAHKLVDMMQEIRMQHSMFKVSQ
jgi:hypothetical protein